MKMLLWRVYLCMVKFNVKVCRWIVLEIGDYHDLWKLGELLLDMEESYPGKRTEGASIVLDYLVDRGLSYMDEAVHGESRYIKAHYDIDMGTNIDEVSEELIEEYFKNYENIWA